MGRWSDAVGFYRPMVPLFGAILCCMLAVGASLAVLPFLVRDEIGGGTVAVGVVVGAIAVAAVLARPVAGRLADRYGYRQVMLVGAAVSALGGVGYLLADSVPALVAVRIVHGVGEGAVYTAGAAWLVSLSPPERRGRVVGLYGIYMWIGITVGALLGTVAMRAGGYPAAWILCVVSILAGLALVASMPPAARATAAGRAAIFPTSALTPGVALSLAALGYAALAGFVALHMAERGVANGIAAFNAFGFTYIGVRLLAGHWPDRLGARRVAIWSAMVEAVGLSLVAVAPNLLVAVVGGLVMGAGLSLLFPALALLVINRTEPAHQGAALGMFTSFWDVGLVVGGPLTGLIVGLAGYRVAFLAMLGFAVVSGAVAAVGIRAAPRSAVVAERPAAG
ncbi:MFS transporter [Solwaraspora sp. WMMD406]|uniref:MFS transporter n=1 Tax=Solwaraspora sp. WMMD406 TaxID=3016095 RepID=UPI002415EDF1|nr:MFS transporter [Solwaraspora sp. WMMD406]MDG4766021.1 MFS transporter [Solwaraspora sp. WMMD406]